jgi:hypothetical protein
MKASPDSRFIRALQVGGLLGLGVFLWGVSLLPIQRSVLVCECSVLVSPREHAKLVATGRQSHQASPSIEWLVCEPLKTHADSDHRSGSEGEVAVRRVQLRLGMVHRVTATELERELTSLTSSGISTSHPTGEVQRAVCHARWRLQVAEHALSRFRLDCARDGVELPDIKESSPFRLASRSSSREVSNAKRSFESLCSEVDAARKGLEQAERESEQREQETPAVFTMGGSPRFVMRGGSLDRVRFSVLVLSICGLLGFVATQRNRKISSKRSGPILSTDQDLMKMLDGLRIPYLGVLPQETDDATAASMVTEIASRSTRSRGRTLYRLLRLYHLSMWARWSERVLALWLVCFVLRYLLDPPWRELLFQAPLAAFSSVLFGV